MEQQCWAKIPQKNVQITIDCWHTNTCIHAMALTNILFSLFEFYLGYFSWHNLLIDFIPDGNIFLFYLFFFSLDYLFVWFSHVNLQLQ